MSKKLLLRLLQARLRFSYKKSPMLRIASNIADEKKKNIFKCSLNSTLLK